jgi:predicted phage tail protein
MTNIIIKGVLGKKFGELFKFKIKNPLEALRAIEVNRTGFFVELKKLNQAGCDYAIIVDGEVIKNEYELQENKKIKTIFIIPTIIGAGFAAPFVAAAIGLAGSKVAVFIIGTILQTAFSLGVSFLISSLQKTAAPPQQRIAVGGASASVEARGKSFIFSNPQNTAKQGSSIPIGYGKFKINSNIIEINIKNYNSNADNKTEFLQSQQSSFISDFIAN